MPTLGLTGDGLFEGGVLRDQFPEIHVLSTHAFLCTLENSGVIRIPGKIGSFLRYSKPQVGWDIALIEELAQCALFIMAQLGRAIATSTCRYSPSFRLDFTLVA